MFVQAKHERLRSGIELELEIRIAQAVAERLYLGYGEFGESSVDDALQEKGGQSVAWFRPHPAGLFQAQFHQAIISDQRIGRAPLPPAEEAARKGRPFGKAKPFPTAGGQSRGLVAKANERNLAKLDLEPTARAG